MAVKREASTRQPMQQPNPIQETDRWITHHCIASPGRPDFTWYVSLETLHSDYYRAMKSIGCDPMARYEFALYVKKILGGNARVAERPFEFRLYDTRQRKWVDSYRKVWVLDGVRYYRDKIGGQLVLGYN